MFKICSKNIIRSAPYFLSLAVLLISAVASAETCTPNGLPTNSGYSPVTPGLDFQQCSSSCGEAPPQNWNWQPTAPSPIAWNGFLPESYGYAKGTFVLNHYYWIGSNLRKEYPYNASNGQKSLVGISTFLNGTDTTDLWLKTNQRVFHVAGADKLKCNYNKDGVNAPFILVANNEIRVGWSLGTPLDRNTMVYSGSSRAFTLQSYEKPLSFYISTSTCTPGKDCRIITFSYVPKFVDSGWRIHKKGKTGKVTYKIAAEDASSPTSPLRIHKKDPRGKSKTLGIALVQPGDPSATPIQVQTKNGKMAVRSFP